MQVTVQQFRAEETKFVKAVAAALGVRTENVAVLSVTAASTSEADRRLLAEGVVVETAVTVPAEDSTTVRDVTAEKLVAAINAELDEEGLASFAVQIATVDVTSVPIDAALDAGPSAAVRRPPGLQTWLLCSLCWCTCQRRISL
mmetsp:Transcript_49014/g.98230  ORF Transcript_49014/g.98230 Transcript_49014/m.98230 type:complete len:144 (-) Transcript_49014:154-585(-)